MDQAQLEFWFNTKGATYTDTGDKTMWCRTTGSGQHKRQCTVQLTIFADGVARIKPLVIFKGTAQRIQSRNENNIIAALLFSFKKIHGAMRTFCKGKAF